MGLKIKQEKKKSHLLSLVVSSDIRQNGIQSAPPSTESFQSGSENSCMSEKGQRTVWLRGRRGAVPGNSCSWLFPSNLHRGKAVRLGSPDGRQRGTQRNGTLRHCKQRNKASVNGQNPQGWVDRLTGSGASERNSIKNIRTKILR